MRNSRRRWKAVLACTLLVDMLCIDNDAVSFFSFACRLRCRLTRLWRHLWGWGWWLSFQPMVGQAWLVSRVQRHTISWGAGGIACWNTGQSKVTWYDEVICVLCSLMEWSRDGSQWSPTPTLQYTAGTAWLTWRQPLVLYPIATQTTHWWSSGCT